ncbi:type 4b pilus protein PilO2 [Nitratidesulfovibrio liaohensis]|jgi:hypothetical protein|uniref:Type 4b pilus protein PilO2 n=1 Tax=Nitratidesulfovibrio liaohensis TaxID=2604158 RepID=A0ABY9R6V9_9BACT|nr:type 4b pilus protein PilO2 [Nitratidesulfovibrio liaohensis]WMW66360.1 type 4b pilus protein PilO2 [Nitratidesulfovibrio liaohensis]
MRLLDLNGRTYAAGLWWQVAEQPGPRKLLRAARATAESTPDDGYDCVVLLPRQFGLGQCPDKPAAHSLAASMRPPTASYLGVFRLQEEVGDDGLWWVFAVRNGLISAEGDRLCQTRAEAISHANSLKDLGGPFDREETFPGMAESLSAISGYLAPRRGLFDRGHPVCPLNDDARRARQRRMTLVFLGCLALLSFGVNHWLDAREAARQRQAVQAAAKAREAARREAVANAARHFARTWLAEALPVPRTAQCITPMLQLPTVASGWRLDAATCGDDALVVTWAHQPGASYTTPPSGARVDTRSATSRVALPGVSGSVQDSALMDVPAVTSRLYQLTQDVAAKLRLTWDQPAKKKVEGVEVVAPWVRGEWELANVPAATLADLSLARELQTLPGLVLASIEYRGGLWTIKGVVHANK